MLIELEALQQEIPAISNMKMSALCECLAMLGFPVDAIDNKSANVILDVDVTANRGDALSHRGLARDLAAKLDTTLSPISVVKNSEGEALLPVLLEADACSIYATAILNIDCSRAYQTPEAVKDFLVAMGSTPKDLAAVDASNELLHRYGHPTHAFDADKLNGGVCVRWAREGESLLALDGLERKLTAQDMVIADDLGPIALAGVIGGESTKVTEKTKKVFLESAYFAPLSVRATARRHGIHTDASHRFGRGADTAFVQTARDLLSDRLIEWCGAELVGSWTVKQCALHNARYVDSDKNGTTLLKEMMDRIAGESISIDDATAILERLGCRVEPLVSGDGLNIYPPSWRHDLCIAEDFAEEVLRIIGYDKICVALPPLEGAPVSLSDSFLQRRFISRRLTQLGFYQTVTLGFIGPEADTKYAKSDIEGRRLQNPLGHEYSVMRGSLLPSLWDVAEANLRNGAKEAKLFEIAPIYESTSVGPCETSVLGMVWAGTQGGEDPLTPARPIMTADLIAIARDLGFTGDVEIITLEQNAFGLEIPLFKLGGLAQSVIPTFKPFSRYPVVTRDLSLMAPITLSYGELEKTVRVALKDAPLQDIRCVDVFKDNKLLAEGKQAWLIRIKFQSFDRTLTGEEVETWVNNAIDAAIAWRCEKRAN